MRKALHESLETAKRKPRPETVVTASIYCCHTQDTQMPLKTRPFALTPLRNTMKALRIRSRSQQSPKHAFKNRSKPNRMLATLTWEWTKTWMNRLQAIEATDAISTTSKGTLTVASLQCNQIVIIAPNMPCAVLRLRRTVEAQFCMPAVLQ